MALDEELFLQSCSPGYVKTNFEFPNGIESLPGMDTEDVADAVVYALSTAPHVNVSFSGKFCSYSQFLINYFGTFRCHALED